MAYYNEDQLHRYFEKAIKRESESQIHKLQKEIDYIYSREIKKIMEQIDIKRQVQLAKELKEVQINYQEELNQIGTGYDEKLILKRSEMTSSVFQAVEEKIITFVQSDAYDVWFKKRLENYEKKVNGYHVILHISIHDIVAEKLIKTIYKDISYEIEHDKGIQLGGFILTISNMNIEIDETLDARLREQKEWFLNHSKLFIRR